MARGAPIAPLRDRGDHACVDLEIIDSDPAVATGVVGPVIVCVWRLPPTEEVVARALAAFDRAAARMTGSFACLLLVEPTSPAPTGPVRERIEAHYDGLPSLTAKVAVLEGQAPWIAESLDVAIDISGTYSRRRRTKVCVDANEGIIWLTRQSEPPMGDAARAVLARAVERLRASLPEA